MKNYLVGETRSGFKTLIYRESVTQRDIRLHSAYDPLKEAERNVSGFTIGRASVILVSGLALGYHVNCLAEKYRDCKILVLEKDPEVVKICKKNNPEIFKKTLVITSPDGIESYFERIDLALFQGIASYIHKPSYQIDPSFYDEMIKNITRYVSSRVSDLLTRFEFEEKWIGNIFKNIKHLSSAEGIGEFFGAFRGYPGIIVSAGPSLKNNIYELAALRNRALIVAVDTAFKVLLQHNIRPHFVVTLDAQKYSLKHFLGAEEGETVLVADVVSCPSILDFYKGPRVISTTAKYYTDSSGAMCRETTPLMDWVENYTGSFGDIQSGGSVATTVFDMLLNFGCSSIILVGQDLAYTGREIHCTGTYHNDDWLPGINRLKNLECINQGVIRKRKIKYVPGYGSGKPVITDFVFDLYKSWFEDSSSRVSVKVINSTEGGAVIKNTVEAKLKNALPEKSPVKSPDSIINEIFKAGKGIFSKSLEKVLMERFVEIEKIISIFESSAIDDNKYNIIKMIESENLYPLFRPFFRKINIYLARRNIDENEAEKMYLEEIRLSALKLREYILSSGYGSSARI